MNALIKILVGMCLVVSLSLSGCIDSVTVDPASGVATANFAKSQDTTTTVKVDTVEDTPEVIETPVVEPEEKPVIKEEEKPVVIEPEEKEDLTDTEEVEEADETEENDTEEVEETPVEEEEVDEVESSNSTIIDETLEDVVDGENSNSTIIDETLENAVIPGTEEEVTEETPVEDVDETVEPVEESKVIENITK